MLDSPCHTELGWNTPRRPISRLTAAASARCLCSPTGPSCSQEHRGELLSPRSHPVISCVSHHRTGCLGTSLRPRPWPVGRDYGPRSDTTVAHLTAGTQLVNGAELGLRFCSVRGGACSRLGSRSTGTADITAVRTGCAAVPRQHHTDHESPPPICRAGLRAMQQLQGPIWSLRLLVSCCQLSCRTTTVAGVSASPGTTPGRQTSLCAA